MTIAMVVYPVRNGDLIKAYAIADVIRYEIYTVFSALHEREIEGAMFTGNSQNARLPSLTS